LIRERGCGMWTGLLWLTKGISMVWFCVFTIMHLRVHKSREISCLAGLLPASQIWLCFVEFVKYLVTNKKHRIILTVLYLDSCLCSTNFNNLYDNFVFLS
jgi:hypothetical protein